MQTSKDYRFTSQDLVFRPLVFFGISGVLLVLLMPYISLPDETGERVPISSHMLMDYVVAVAAFAFLIWNLFSRLHLSLGDDSLELLWKMGQRGIGAPTLIKHGNIQQVRKGFQDAGLVNSWALKNGVIPITLELRDGSEQVIFQSKRAEKVDALLKILRETLPESVEFVPPSIFGHSESDEGPEPFLSRVAHDVDETQCQVFFFPSAGMTRHKLFFLLGLHVGLPMIFAVLFTFYVFEVHWWLVGPENTDSSHAATTGLIIFLLGMMGAGMFLGQRRFLRPTIIRARRNFLEIRSPGWIGHHERTWNAPSSMPIHLHPRSQKWLASPSIEATDGQFRADLNVRLTPDEQERLMRGIEKILFE